MTVSIIIIKLHDKCIAVFIDIQIIDISSVSFYFHAKCIALFYFYIEGTSHFQPIKIDNSIVLTSLLYGTRVFLAA